jgi:hypothetical protein
MKKLFFAQVASLSLLVASASAQVLLSGGTYSQSFDFPALEQSTNPNTNWVNNSDILGWYAETSFGSITNYRVSSGGVNNGAMYSFGASANPERALGAIPSGTYANVTYGVRMQNNTTDTIDSFTIGYTGEQWRNGGPTPTAIANTLAFSYRISSSAITSPDWANANTWNPVIALDFISPIFTTTAASLDGNLAANRIVLGATISGLSLTPGQEIFFRWYDINDVSNDHGLAVDDLTISYTTTVPEPTAAALAGIGLLLVCNRIRSSRKA